MKEKYVPLKPGDQVVFMTPCVDQYFGQHNPVLNAQLQLSGLMGGADYTVQKAGKPETGDNGKPAQSIQIWVEGRLMSVNSAFFERK